VRSAGIRAGVQIRVARPAADLHGQGGLPGWNADEEELLALMAPDRLVVARRSRAACPLLGVVTVTDAVAVCVVGADEPVTVKVAVAAGAEAAAVSVSVELPPAVTEPGLNEPVTPVGRPDTESAMLCVLPFSAVEVTV